MYSETESNMETSGSVEPSTSVCRGPESTEVQEQQESQGEFGSMCGMYIIVFQLAILAFILDYDLVLDLWLDAFGLGCVCVVLY